jgi:hypothetical protein
MNGAPDIFPGASVQRFERVLAYLASPPTPTNFDYVAYPIQSVWFDTSLKPKLG